MIKKEAKESRIFDKIILSESMYFILLVLQKPLHGYGIMQEVEIISNGRITLGPGTLYGALNNLLEKNLIIRVENDNSTTENETQISSNRRKVYIITEKGKNILCEESKKFMEYAEIAKKHILK